MAFFKCKMCGGALEINSNDSVATCEYCGTKQTLPRLDDEHKAQLYDRANHFRRSNEFDKAAGIYEQILSQDNTDAESYWSLVLCRYGIEYVEDPNTHKRVPTVNRAQYSSIFADGDYQSALQYADGYQAEIYEEEAKAIDEIQKGILEISSQEEPFDVFICYKETDNNGRRTPDSVYAQDIYKALTDEGYNVFFSRITLEDKLGSAYEPYIFAALNSAKVMLVVGTKGDYFNAIWVKNEWSRFLALINAGKKKSLIPVYKDMDPYDLPEEFAYLQAQDLGKLGAVQDIVRGVSKLVTKNENNNVKRTLSAEEQLVESLTKKAYDFIKSGDIKSANITLDNLYTYDSNNANYYIGKLLIDHSIRTVDRLVNAEKPFDKDENFKNALKCANSEFKKELLNYKDNALFNICTKTFKEDNNIEKLKESSVVIQRINTSEDADFADKVTRLSKDIENKIEKLEAKKKRVNRIKKIVCVCLAVAILVTIYLLPPVQYGIGIGAIHIKCYKIASWHFKNSNYKDSNFYANVLGIENIGENVTLGFYEQDGNYDNGAEPIEWTVIARNGDRVLLLTKDALTAVGYGEEVSEDWLNSFNDEMFYGIDMKLPVEKIFLLSADEINEYLKETSLMTAKISKSKIKQYYIQTDNGNICWATSETTQFVDLRGEIATERFVEKSNGFGYVVTHVGIRPAMWIDLSK